LHADLHDAFGIARALATTCLASSSVWVMGFSSTHPCRGDGRQRDGRVPVVRRSDEDGIDIFAVQEFLVRCA
jgi:hypothetical protein